MNRQIKELWKQAAEIERQHNAEDELGCGFMPAEAHDYFNRLYGEVVEKIAKLRGFDSWNDYMFHEIDCERDAYMARHGEELPFN